MSIPLDHLITKDKNAYILTCAIIKRAAQITASGEDIEMNEKGKKVVSESIEQVITGNVEYQLED